MKKRIINIIKLLLSFFLFLYIKEIVSFIGMLFGYDISNLSLLGKTILNVILSTILLIISIFIYWKDVTEDIKEFKVNLKSKIIFSLKVFGIFILLKFAASYISVIFSSLFEIKDITSENQNTITELLGLYPILMSFSAVFLAPIYEEILFRLGFKKCIDNKIVFILISGTLFGLIHIFPTDLNIGVALIQSIVYIVMGILLAYYYQKYDNICYSILLHFYNNFLSIILILISFISNLI